MCEICCKYGIWLGVPGESSHAHLRVITSARGPLATSKQIAGSPENRKTEIRTPQYARRQDRQLQNGPEWQEDKIGTKVTHSRVPRGAGGFHRAYREFRVYGTPGQASPRVRVRVFGTIVLYADVSFSLWVSPWVRAQNHGTPTWYYGD